MGYFTANVKFNYSRPIPFWMRPSVEREYLRLRSLACDELNQHYSEWNAEYSASHPDEVVDHDDPMEEFGGAEYCGFLNSKQQPIIDEINRKHANNRVRLCAMDSCDLGCIILGRFDTEISRMHITLSDISEIVWDD